MGVGIYWGCKKWDKQGGVWVVGVVDVLPSCSAKCKQGFAECGSGKGGYFLEKVGKDFWVEVDMMDLGMGIAGVDRWQMAVVCARLLE